MLRLISLVLLTLPFCLNGQFSQKLFYTGENRLYERTKDSLEISFLRTEYSQNKSYPKELELPILVALGHFPELVHVDIQFCLNEAVDGLEAGPQMKTFNGLRRRRQYLVQIGSLYPDSIIAGNDFLGLAYNAQIGAIGRELAKVAAFESGSGQSLSVKGKKVASVEKPTLDLELIHHNLGYQLKDWLDHLSELQVKNSVEYQGLKKGELDSILKTRQTKHDSFVKEYWDGEMLSNRKVHCSVKGIRDYSAQANFLVLEVECESEVIDLLINDSIWVDSLKWPKGHQFEVHMYQLLGLHFIGGYRASQGTLWNNHHVLCWTNLNPEIESRDSGNSKYCPREEVPLWIMLERF